MENTSEKESHIENIYKEKLDTLISENRSFFITGVIALVFIIYIFLLQLGGQAIARFRNNLISLFAFDANIINRSDISPDLSDKLTNKSIDYISPSQIPSGTRLDDTGQISAISSGKVTYTKNKYIVQPGDSLATIAQQVYGDREAWVRIAKANNLASPDNIEIGMELVIPR